MLQTKYVLISEKDNYNGEYIKVKCDEAVSCIEIDVESVEADAIVASHRIDPFWFRTKYCRSTGELPEETVFFAVKNSKEYTLFYSLACERMRTVFHSIDNKFAVSAITGDKNIKYDEFYAYYKISGENFYELFKLASESIVKKFGTTELRKNKKKPRFIQYFGWCTWDSFYHSVSEENIRHGIESFKEGGVIPKFLLIDDGWQSTNCSGEDENADWVGSGLTDFKANYKFGNGFKNIVDTLKNDYGVKEVLVWHAILGYWSGVDIHSPEMQNFRPEIMHSVHPEGLKKVNPDMWNNEKRDFGMIDLQLAYDFYNKYHSYLKNEGIDGVKVDSQGTADSISEGLGGRCNVVSLLHNALEKSAEENFDGELLNCMACSNDSIYHMKNSNITRTSDDFMPEKPETHIKHIYDNAVNSLWIREFAYCDWDMFQTTHEFGEYHAAARAISGSPVYVSDCVDEHNFEIIKALTDECGNVLLPEDVAVLTSDSLFRNITEEKVPFKIFNRNKCGGVVGVFSGETENTSLPHSVRVSPFDIYGFSDGKYAAYSRKNKKHFILDFNESITIELSAKEYDIITFAKIENDFAVIGITDKFNCGGTVLSADRSKIELKCGGNLLYYKDGEFVFANVDRGDFIIK